MQLRSVEAVISALGGELEAAMLADVGITAVMNWKGRDNRIPSRHFLLFSQVLAKKKMRAEPALFGLRTLEDVR